MMNGSSKYAVMKSEKKLNGVEETQSELLQRGSMQYSHASMPATVRQESTPDADSANPAPDHSVEKHWLVGLEDTRELLQEHTHTHTQQQQQQQHS